MTNVSAKYLAALNRFYEARAKAPAADVRSREGDPAGDPLTDAEMAVLEELVVAVAELERTRTAWRKAGRPSLSSAER